MLPDLRKKYGVVVAARAAGSAYSTTLDPGDVIYAVNGGRGYVGGRAARGTQQAQTCRSYSPADRA